MMPLSGLETIAAVNWDAARPRSVHPGVLFDLTRIRRLYDSAAQTTSRNFDVFNFGPYDQRTLEMKPNHFMDPSATLPSTTSGKLRTRRLATRTLARAFAMNDVACAALLMRGRPLLQTFSQHNFRLQGQNEGIHVEVFRCLSQTKTHGFATLPPALVTRLSKLPKEWQAKRTLGILQVGSGLFYEGIENLSAVFTVGGFWGADIDRGEEMRKAHEKHAATRLPPADKQRSGDLMQILYYRGTADLGIAWERIGASFELGRKGDEEGRTKAREYAKTHAGLALVDFLGFLAYLDYAPDVPKQAATDHTKTLLGSNTPAPPASQRIFAVSELFQQAAPFSPFNRSSSSDSAENSKSHHEVVTFHPLLGEVLYSVLLCCAMMGTPAPELLHHAQNAAHLHQISDPFPFTKLDRPRAMIDFEAVL